MANKKQVETESIPDTHVDKSICHCGGTREKVGMGNDGRHIYARYRCTKCGYEEMMLEKEY